MQQEIEEEEQLNKLDDISGDTNPYKELIVNNEEKLQPLMTQMEQWSILSNVLNYIQQGKQSVANHNLSVRAVNKHKNGSEVKEEREITELDFGVMPKIPCKEYLDVYDGIQSEIVSATIFDENSDLSMTYLDRSDKMRNDKLKAEESFPISENRYTLGKLLDGTECQLLLETGACKSFMSKSFYM